MTFKSMDYRLENPDELGTSSEKKSVFIKFKGGGVLWIWPGNGLTMNSKC